LPAAKARGGVFDSFYLKSKIFKKAKIIREKVPIIRVF
jgi:hypothetical protein